MAEADKRNNVLSNSEQTRKAHTRHLPLNTFKQHGPPTGDTSHATKAKIGPPTPLKSVSDDCEAHSHNGNTAGARSTNKSSTKVPIAENVAGLGSPLFEEPIIVYGSANHTKFEWLEEDNNAYGDENDCNSPVSPYEEAPQLQAWIYETSNTNLTFGERLQKGYWRND
ncbi:hypothetical protein DL95DRAFT_518817 [Leptodontidium sp. 2 PMI_412]|nr:hypothetical protein DL95DRAFT_518817 [Leptodontidium sp. 2 PMI_412]